MEVKIVDLPEIAIIGMEGFRTEKANIVQSLWQQVNETFTKVLESEIPSRHLILSGAACDYTEPSTGKNFIFFPVEEA